MEQGTSDQKDQTRSRQARPDGRVGERYEGLRLTKTGGFKHGHCSGLSPVASLSSRPFVSYWLCGVERRVIAWTVSPSLRALHSADHDGRIAMAADKRRQDRWRAAEMGKWEM